jgi:GTPase
MREGIAAIVGEPNVGKSTLLNKIIKERIALTSPVAGTTRDRFYASTDWNGLEFSLVDTAGIILERRDELEQNIQKQVDIALQEADVIIYVVDGKKGPESVDRSVLQKIRKHKKDVILVINKTDSPKKINETIGLYQFTGIKKIFPVSAVSGVNLGDMLDGITDYLLEKGFKTIEKDPTEISISIVGKPNVGKSSLFNHIIGEERVVVSEVAGTTRNVVDTEIVYNERKIKILDTAGLKKKEKRAPLPDIYAAFQTLRAMHKSDIIILVIDASEGITQQDQKIAGEIVEAGKGLIMVANKIDKLNTEEREKLQNNLPKYFEFLWWAPAVPVSAKTGEGVTEMLDYVLTIDSNRHKTIENQELSEFFYAKLKQREPQRIRDERAPRVFSLHQTATNPPVFTMIVNRPSAISTQFRRFIQNAIIKELNFWGTPIKLRLEEKKGNPEAHVKKHSEE